VSHRASRAVAVATAVAAVSALSFISPVSAQTWINTGSGNWNTATNWSTGAVPTSANTTALVFDGTTSYTATNNTGAASSTFDVNSLTFNNSSSGGVTIGFAGTTRLLRLSAASIPPAPTLTQNGSGPVAINGTLLLTDAAGSSSNITSEITGTGTGSLSITELRYNVNNTPTVRFSGSYDTTIGKFYKQQGNKTITNNTVAGKTLTIGTIELQTNNNANNLTFNGSGNTIVTGAITPTLGASGTNGGTLIYSGTGSLTLQGSNTFTGTVTVSDGTLNVSNLAAGGNLGNATTPIILGSAATQGTLHYTGSSASFTRGFTLNGAGGGRINVANLGETLTLDTVGVSGTTGTLTIGGAGNTVINPAVQLGSGGITKAGTGNLTLNGTNVYSGATNVLGGTLVQGVAGALGSSNTFNISPGAELNAAVGGLNIATGGAIVAGRSTGFANDVVGNINLGAGATLTVAGNSVAGTFTHAGNLALAGGSSLRFDLRNTTTVGAGVNDLIAVSGNLTLPTGTDTVAVNVTGLNGPLAAGNYTLLTYGGTLSGGGAANLAAPTGLAVGRSTYSYDTTSVPGSVLLVVGGGAANLTWVGNGTTNPWDNSTTGVFTGGSPDQFFDGDVVNFTDSGAANGNVNLAGSLAPFAANVNSSADYTFAGTGAISGNAQVNKAGTGTLTIQNTNTYTGVTTLNGGTLVVASNGALGDATQPTVVNAGAQLRVSGGVNTPEAITLSGTGIANAGALQNGVGVNTVSGTVTLAADALIANNNLTDAFTIDVPAGNAIVGTGANLSVNATGDVVVNGAIALGSGSLTKLGAGKLTLGGSAASTGTGAVLVNAGTLELNKTATAINGPLVVGDGVAASTVRLLATEQINNNSTVTVQANATFDLNGNGESIGSLAGTGTATSATPASLTITSGVVNNLLAGSLGVIKANAGLLALNNTANTFTGTLQGNNGILEVASLADSGPGSQGTGTIRLLNGTNAAASLRYTGGATTISRSIDIFATGTGAGTGSLESSGSGPLTWTGGVSLSSAGAVKTFGLAGTNTGENVFSGVIANGVGTLALEKSGAGHWTITNAANSFSGNVTVSAGTLRVPAVGVLGTGTKTVSVAGGARPSLLLDGTAGNLVFPASISFSASSDGTLGTQGSLVNVAGDNVINGAISLVNGGGGDGRLTVNAGTLTVAGAINANGATGGRTLLIGGAGNGTVSGVIADGISGANTRVVGVQKDGAGAWTFGGDNAFTGSVAIQAGTLRVAKLAANGTAQPLGQSATAITFGGASTAGTLEYTGATPADLARPLTVSGAGGGIVRNGSGQTLSLSGAITTSGRTLTLTGGAFNVTGVIGGTAADSNVVVDNANVQVSAAATHNGTFTVRNGGTVRNGTANALSPSATLVLGDAANTAGTYDLNGFDQAVAAIADVGTGARVITNNAASGLATLSVSGTGTFGGTIQNGPTANVALAKTTGGTLSLTSANSYSGGTVVSAGALVVAANGALGTGPVTVSGTGTLSGTGSIAGSVQVTGGTLAPGNSPGALTLGGGLSFTGGTLSVEILGNTPGATYDQLVVTSGNVSLGLGVAALAGDTGSYSPAAGEQFWVVNNTGTGVTTGYFLDSLGGALQTDGSLVTVGSQQFQIYYGADFSANALIGGNDVVLVATGVPEPTSVAALSLATVGLLGRRRRRSRQI
jgi:autotransporter-associated beta strand protein